MPRDIAVTPYHKPSLWPGWKSRLRESATVAPVSLVNYNSSLGYPYLPWIHIWNSAVISNYSHVCDQASMLPWIPITAGFCGPAGKLLSPSHSYILWPGWQSCHEDNACATVSLGGCNSILVYLNILTCAISYSGICTLHWYQHEIVHKSYHRGFTIACGPGRSKSCQRTKVVSASGNIPWDQLHLCSPG